MLNNNSNEISKAYRSELVLISKSAGITAFGFIFLNIVSFASNALITRYLGADQYGVFVLVTRILELLVVIASFGFSSTIIKYTAHYFARMEYGYVKGTILYSARVMLLVSLLIMTAGFILSGPILFQIFERSELGPLLRILLISLPFSMLIMIYISSLNGLKKIKEVVIIQNIVNPVLFILITGGVILLDWGIRGMMWVYLATAIITMLISRYALKATFFNERKEVSPIVEKGILWKFSTPLFLFQVINNIIRLIPVSLLGIYVSFVDIGIFNVSFKIALIIGFSLDAFAMIFSPSMAELFAKGDRLMIGKLYKTITKWIFTFSLAIFFIIMLFPGPLLMIFGSDFTSGTMELIVISTGILINTSTGLVGNLLIMSGRPRTVMINATIKLLIICALCFILIPSMGILGAAIALSATTILINLIMIGELYFAEKIHPLKKSYFKPPFAGIISYIAVYFVFQEIQFDPFIELLSGSVLFILIYGLLNWAFRLDEEDKLIVNTLIKYTRR